MNTIPDIALVGCGYWGKNLCGNFYDFGSLASVVDDTEKGQETARSIAPEARITDDLDDILGDDQLKGVALATPAETHAELSCSSYECRAKMCMWKNRWHC